MVSYNHLTKKKKQVCRHGAIRKAFALQFASIGFSGDYNLYQGYVRICYHTADEKIRSKHSLEVRCWGQRREEVVVCITFQPMVTYMLKS